MPSKRFYVYVLTDPLEDRPIYVGKGSGKRAMAHSVEARGGCECKKCCAIREIWDGGRDVRVDYVFETDSEHAALDHEKEVILRIGLKNLTNIVAGHAPWYDYPVEQQIDYERIRREWESYRLAANFQRKLEKRQRDQQFLETYYPEIAKARRQREK